MAQRICSIEDCGGAVLARNWCSKHYGSWSRHGEPEAAPRRNPKGFAACQVADCSRPVTAKNFCNSHYKLWRKYGTPTPRHRAAVVDGKKVCSRCTRDLPVADFPPDRMAWCRSCLREAARSYFIPATTAEAVCYVCDQPFDANAKKRISCSPQCSAIADIKRNWKNVQKRRMRQRAVTVENFLPREVFERDAWICRLCGTPIDQAAKAPHPLSPSIDHIVPISRGGEHSRANTQASHLGCNVKKGARLLPDRDVI